MGGVGRDVERTDADVEVLRETLGASRELAALFESPVVPRERKEAVARRLFDERLGPEASAVI